MIGIKNAQRFVLALLAFSALAIPASASATDEWTHEGNPLEGHVEIKATGPASFQIPGIASYECEAHLIYTISDAGVTTVTKYEFTTDKCKGGGLLAKCKLKEEKITNLPWPAHVMGGGFVITDTTIDYTFEVKPGECEIEEIKLSFKKVENQPDNPEEISDVSISGVAENGAIASGTQEITPSGTYGVN
ncbi:MAG TPA: hypothetical protein VNP96_07925 [Solirubrobacterales bacterium]|nr:hypothetical protein [Solirubrobacterales bacterium]